MKMFEMALQLLRPKITSDETGKILVMNITSGKTTKKMEKNELIPSVIVTDFNRFICWVASAPVDSRLF